MTSKQMAPTYSRTPLPVRAPVSAPLPDDVIGIAQSTRIIKNHDTLTSPFSQLYSSHRSQSPSLSHALPLFVFILYIPPSLLSFVRQNLKWKYACLRC